MLNCFVPTVLFLRSRGLLISVCVRVVSLCSLPPLYCVVFCCTGTYSVCRTSAGATTAEPMPRLVTFVQGGGVHCTCADFKVGNICRHVFQVVKFVAAERSSDKSLTAVVIVRRIASRLFEHLLHTRWFMTRGFVPLPAQRRPWPKFGFEFAGTASAGDCDCDEFPASGTSV